MPQPEAFLGLMNNALNGMVQIVEELGDDRVNQRPDFAESNSPYAILAHCVGLTHYWIGRVCGGRPYERDRDGEFNASGTVADIRQAVRDLQAQLQEDIKRVRYDQPAVGKLAPRHDDLHDFNQGDFMLRCFKELAQHHGHMELTRDILQRPA